MTIPTYINLTPVSLIRYHGKYYVCQHLRIGVSTLNRWIRNGNFPAPLKVGKRVIGWPPELIKYVKNYP
ncbi:AlpA family phage regulatory protein [Tatumella sp. UCD-D_suzukii]|uniref:helix-turn-helix transcriptional regulator n=1 Tax=Tatumella sp. UCD-D_suzukii TaxID=1408192 RepID=UPI00093CAF32